MTTIKIQETMIEELTNKVMEYAKKNFEPSYGDDFPKFVVIGDKTFDVESREGYEEVITIPLGLNVDFDDLGPNHHKFKLWADTLNNELKSKISSSQLIDVVKEALISHAKTTFLKLSTNEHTDEPDFFDIIAEYMFGERGFHISDHMYGGLSRESFMFVLDSNFEIAGDGINIEWKPVWDDEKLKEGILQLLEGIEFDSEEYSDVELTDVNVVYDNITDEVNWFTESTSSYVNISELDAYSEKYIFSTNSIENLEQEALDSVGNEMMNILEDFLEQIKDIDFSNMDSEEMAEKISNLEYEY